MLDSHIPIILTSHFMCVQTFHMVDIDVPTGIGAPPLDKQPHYHKGITMITHAHDASRRESLLKKDYG